MPRKGRGGSRQGQAGKAYANRTDLTQAPAAAATDTYGEAAALKRGQEMVPLPQAPPVAGPAPGELTSLSAPSMRPAEPVTAGMDRGPGPGSESLAIMPDPVLETLRAAYARFPNESIGAMLERFTTERR